MGFGSDAGGASATSKRPWHVAETPRGEDHLTTRLRAIAKEVASPEDALEPMLRAVMESTGAAAGAVCLYDVRLRLLRLAAEVGLSDEGCRRLRIIRKGEADAWEMPMHGLVNGRAYLIDNASQNRFVPPLVENAAEMNNVVCLPLYSGQTPLASIVLVALKPRTFAERQLHAVEAPLQEMARVIETTRRHAESRSAPSVAAGPTPASNNTHAAATPPVAAPPATPPVVPTAQRPAVDAASAAALARVEQERDRLAAALKTAQGESARGAEVRAELERVRARLGDVEAAEARERRAREEIEARFAGGASAGRLELQRAQDAVREAENGRMAALAESARLRAELERAQMEVARSPAPALEADARVADLATEVDRLRAKLAEAEAGAAHEQRAREELEGRLAGGLNAGQHELRQAVAGAREAERQRLAAVAEASRLRTELELARLEAAPGPANPEQRDERIGPLLAEIDRLRARLAEAEAGAAHEHRARDQLEIRLAQSVTTTQQELRRALEIARDAEDSRATAVAETARLRAELEQAETRAALAPGTSDEMDVRVVELAAEIDRLRTRVAEAEAGAAHQHRAREELEARLTGGVTSGQQELRRALEAAREAEQGRVAAVAEAARLAAEAEQLRLAAAQEPERSGQVAARWSELTAEIDRLHTRLAEAEAGAAHEHRAREALEARLDATGSDAEHALHQLRESVRAVEQARDAAFSEAARLGAQLDEARAEAARLPTMRVEAETHAAALAAEVQRLSARVVEIEAIAAREQHTREVLEARLGESVAAAEREREAAVADVRARSETSAREDAARLEAELAAARVAADRAEALAAALGAAETARRDADEALARVVAERDALACAVDDAAARATGEAGERFAVDLASFRAEHARELEALRARLVDAEAGAAREQRAREALEAAASHDLGRIGDDLQQAIDAVRSAEEGRDRNAAELAAARAELAAVRDDAARAAAELAGTRDDRDRLRAEAAAAAEARDASARLAADAERAAVELDARLAAVAAERVRERDEAAAALAALGEELRSTTAEGGRQRAAHAGLAAERDRVAAELAGVVAAKERIEEALAAALGEAGVQNRVLAEALERGDELAARLAERDGELHALRDAGAAEAAALGARAEALVAEVERGREAQAALAGERDRLAADLEGLAAAKAHLERAFQQTTEDGRERERVAVEAAARDAALVAERDAALRALEERLTAELGGRDARLRDLAAETDALREASDALRAERDRLAAELEGAAAGKTHLDRALAEALDDARTRSGELHDARGHTWELALRVEQTEAMLCLRAEEHAAQVARLNERLETFLLAADQLREAHANIGAECDRLSADLEGATAAKAHLEETLQRTLDEGREREQEATDHLTAARAHHWTTAARLAETEQRLAHLADERASETAALATRVESLEADADRLRESNTVLGGERDRLTAALEGAAAAKAHLERSLESALDAARTREQDATTLLQETRGQAWVTAVRLAETELSLRVLADERTAEVEALRARTTALVEDAERLRAAETSAASERDHLAAELAGTRAAHELVEKSLAEAREREREWSEREQTSTARIGELEGEVAAVRGELAAAESARTDAETARADAEAARVDAEAARVDAETARGTAESARLEAEAARAAADAARADAEARAGLGPRDAASRAPAPIGDPRLGSVAPARPAPPPLRPATPPSPARRVLDGSPSAARPASPLSRLVAVIDDDGAWRGVPADPSELVLATTAADAIAKVVAAAPGRVLVNVAAAGAMKALLALREQAATTQIFGYVGKGDADRVVPLGRVEPASRPLAPDAIVAALGAVAPPKARVVTVGADVDALLSLRQALVRQGTSVSLAWDAKQAIDLLDMINPHAVVADLGAPQDASAVLARVAVGSPVPIVVLIEGTTDVTAALVTMLNHPELAPKLVSRPDLVALLARGGSPARSAPGVTARPLGLRR